MLLGSCTTHWKLESPRELLSEFSVSREVCKRWRILQSLGALDLLAGSVTRRWYSQCTDRPIQLN